MALPARVKSLDDVDAAFHSEYSEQGGEYVLQVDGIKEHPTVTGLQKAYEAEKRRASDRAEKLKAFGELTPEDAESLRAELEQLRESKGGDLISAEELKDLKERQKELARAAKRAEELEREIQFRDKDQGKRLRSEILSTLAAAGVRQEEINDAAARIQVEYSPRWDRSDDGFVPVVTGELNGVPGDHNLNEFVGEFVKAHPKYLAPSGKGGSGAPANGNPRSNGGSRGSINRNDPMAWGNAAEGIAKGEVAVND